MRLRKFAAAALLAAAVYPAWAMEPLPAPKQPTLAEAPATEQLMESFGLEGLFVRFGQSLAAGPRLNGIEDPRFLAAWEASASSSFASPALDTRLRAALGAALSPDELLQLNAFIATALGTRIATLEQAIHEAAPERQLAIIAKGGVLLMSASEARRVRLEELMQLTGAELTFDILGESLRGMAMGLHLSAGTGDIEVPWDEIDAEVSAQLAGMRVSLADTTRSVFAYTYASLTEEELEAYLVFLRSPVAQKFYAAATLAIGDIMRDAMFRMGESVSLRLQRVNV